MSISLLTACHHQESNKQLHKAKSNSAPRMSHQGDIAFLIMYIVTVRPQKVGL